MNKSQSLAPHIVGGPALSISPHWHKFHGKECTVFISLQFSAPNLTPNRLWSSEGEFIQMIRYTSRWCVCTLDNAAGIQAGTQIKNSIPHSGMKKCVKAQWCPRWTSGLKHTVHCMFAVLEYWFWVMTSRILDAIPMILHLYSVFLNDLGQWLKHWYNKKKRAILVAESTA